MSVPRDNLEVVCYFPPVIFVKSEVTCPCLCYLEGERDFVDVSHLSMKKESFEVVVDLPLYLV